jgi:hypothetical protein
VNILRTKWGPLEVWVWLALVTALGLGYYLYERHKNGAAATPASSASGASDTAPEVVVQAGGTTQQTTPAAEPGMTAAQAKELSTLQSEEKSESTQVNKLGKQAETQAAVNRSQGAALKKLTHPKAKAKTAKPPARHPAPAKK